MTRLELLTLLGVRLQDAAAVRWDGTQQPDALNMVYEDFCSRTECVQGLTTLVQSAGAVYVPATDELFSAGRGAGATLDGAPIRCGGATDAGVDTGADPGSHRSGSQTV